MSTVVSSIFTLSALAASATATPKSVYFMESTRTAGPGFANKMYRYDSGNQSVTRVQVDGITPWRAGYAEAYNSGAALCGKTYYAAWNDINQAQAGLAAIVLSGSNSGSYTQIMLPPGSAGSDAGDMYHNVWCDPADSTKVFVVRSTTGSPRALFSLRHFNWATGNDTKIFDFSSDFDWASSDTTFAFDPAKRQFWSTWSVDQPKGHPFEKTSVLDMVTLAADNTPGQMQRWKMGGKGGWLYELFPNTGDGQFRATLHHKGSNSANVENLLWADLALGSDGTVTAKEGADVTSTMFTGGQPTALCGGLLWSVPEGGNDDTPFIYGVNPVAGGKVELTINLQQFEAASWAGAVAC